MSFFKRRPLLTALLIVVIAACVGAFIGGAYARHETQLIAEEMRRRHPNDPLDGLAFIGFGYILIGLAYGTATGLVVALIVYVYNKRQSKLP